MKHKDAGQGLVEYALVLVLVAIVAIAILAILGPMIGNTFSQIIFVLDNPPGMASISEASSAESPSFDTAEKVMDFWEETDDQDEAIAEVSTLLVEVANETLELITEYAFDVGEQVLIERFNDIRQLVEEGRYGEIPGLLVNPAELPVEVNSAVIHRVEPLFLEMCGLLEDAVVSEESMIEVRQAILEQEGALPRSTGNALELLDDIWSQVDQKNRVIELFFDPTDCPSE